MCFAHLCRIRGCPNCWWRCFSFFSDNIPDSSEILFISLSCRWEQVSFAFTRANFHYKRSILHPSSYARIPYCSRHWKWPWLRSTSLPYITTDLLNTRDHRSPSQLAQGIYVHRFQKNDNPEDAAACRPVNLISALCKLREKLPKWSSLCSSQIRNPFHWINISSFPAAPVCLIPSLQKKPTILWMDEVHMVEMVYVDFAKPLIPPIVG